MNMKLNTIRPYLLITLIHAETTERKKIDRGVIKERIIKMFQCRSVIIAKENHGEKGFHYHIGVWNESASKNNLAKGIRNGFKEWDGRCIDVKAHKGWGTICKYILKEDKEPLIWGEYSLEQTRGLAKAHEQHKEAQGNPDPSEILKRLEKTEDWYQVYRDDILQKKVLMHLPRMKEAYEDLKILKDIETNTLERIVSYLIKRGEPREYDVEELREKYLVIDWIACQICFKRPIKTKQLFIYGEPSTQKTLLFHLLAKVLRIYFASARRNDFTGANDYYDLWAFDEFHEPNDESSLIGATAEGTAFANTILKVLDGQECRLDSKYARVFKKKRNVPIVMIANKLPQIMRQHGPFRARFYRVRFSSNIEHLEEERIVATLYGCIMRRACKSPYFKERSTPTEVILTYNKTVGTFIPIEDDPKEMKNSQKKWKQYIKNINIPYQRELNPEAAEYILKKEVIFITNKGKIYEVKIKKIKTTAGGSYLMFELQTIDGEECYTWGEQENEMALLDFACIPVKKKEEKEEKKRRRFLQLFKSKEEYEEENQEGSDEENEGEREQDESAETKKIKRIFYDKRDWTARSYMEVKRSKGAQKGNDYATWPLQIQIGETRVFPATIQVSKRREEEEFYKKKYEKIEKIVEEMTREKGYKPMPCEIFLTQNGEKEEWDLDQ